MTYLNSLADVTKRACLPKTRICWWMIALSGDMMIVILGEVDPQRTNSQKVGISSNRSDFPNPVGRTTSMSWAIPSLTHARKQSACLGFRYVIGSSDRRQFTLARHTFSHRESLITSAMCSFVDVWNRDDSLYRKGFPDYLRNIQWRGFS